MTTRRYARRRGFTEIERYDGMALELAGLDLPAADLPARIEIVTWAERPDLTRESTMSPFAFHDTTGVKRTWRGRGVAGALKRAEVAWAKQRGFERLMTANEMRNEPIRRLNARLGYREAPRRVLMRGPLFGGR